MHGMQERCRLWLYLTSYWTGYSECNLQHSNRSLQGSRSSRYLCPPVVQFIHFLKINHKDYWMEPDPPKNHNRTELLLYTTHCRYNQKRIACQCKAKQWSVSCATTELSR
jgi:hypothetical protein